MIVNVLRQRFVHAGVTCSITTCSCGVREGAVPSAFRQVRQEILCQIPIWLTIYTSILIISRIHELKFNENAKLYISRERRRLHTIIIIINTKHHGSAKSRSNQFSHTYIHCYTNCPTEIAPDRYRRRSTLFFLNQSQIKDNDIIDILITFLCVGKYLRLLCLTHFFSVYLLKKKNIKIKKIILN